MALRIPMYDGDSFIRPGMSRNEPATTRIEPVSDVPTVAELARIEREARRLRSEVVGGLFARLFGWLAGQHSRANQRAMERAIGRPTDAADLERRLRAFERRPHSHAV